MAARGDKTAKNRFETWLQEKQRLMRWYEPGLHWGYSPLHDARRDYPHVLFYFFLNLLQDMVL
jgi:hypothetical protein